MWYILSYDTILHHFITKQCEISNIPKTIVCYNLKRIRKGKSEIGCPGSDRKYSEKVGKILTLSKNTAEGLTSCYKMGRNKQVQFYLFLWTEIYPKSSTLKFWGGDCCFLILWETIYPNCVLQQGNARLISVTGSHWITWP